MMPWLRDPWPWWIAGPLIGLCVPALLLIGNRQLGTTGALRAICAALVPRRIPFLQYDWRRNGAWSMALLAGMLAGGAIAVGLLKGGEAAISAAARASIETSGVPVGGLVPSALFAWDRLLTLRGAVFMLGGGFLVGFGSSYAGGCTSGHGVMGLAARQPASLIALIGIFAGGILATFLVIPILLGLGA